MTTILAFFIISLSISIVVTPYIKKVGRWIRALDYPDERKIHNGVIPRCGGLAVYLGFFLPFLLLLFHRTAVTELLPWNRMVFGFWAGSSLILLVGLWDDIRGLRASTKFVLQIMVAILAWWSGFQIDSIFLPYLGSVELALLGFPVTVFWFVMVINAINFMDGLDGLATGIALFASIILTVVSLLRNNYLAALIFASFCGALLGFLRYNFNPASIFLGDSGSYFIGFVLAALGLGTLQKSSVTVAILIPVVALGLPLMDMILAAIRRFLYGAKIFAPDREHLHHQLLRLGYTPRRATLMLFVITAALGLLALLIENLRGNPVGLILGALAIVSILGIRKLGYVEYFTADKVLGWFAGITDEAGINRDRRTFLSKQMAICGSYNIYQFWGRTIHAAKKLNLNAALLELHPESFNNGALSSLIWEDGLSGEPRERENDRCLLVELPLVSNGNCYGRLRLRKSLQQTSYDRFLFRRLEQLRGSVTDALENLAEKSISCPEVQQDRRRGCHRPDIEAEDGPESGKSGGYEKPKFLYSGNMDRRNFFWKEETKRKSGVKNGRVTDKP